MKFKCALFLLFCILNQSYCFSRVSHHHRDQVILISLDGIQAGIFDKYLKEHENSSFNQIVRTGVKAEYMIPSFPTVTWPNHYSLVTGLYSESHGIIDNYMYDPEYDEKVNFLGGLNAYNPKFWKNTKPIWTTEQEQVFLLEILSIKKKIECLFLKELKTAASYWVGSEIVGQTPDIWIKYDSNYWKTFIEDYKVSDRVNDVVNWIHKFKLDLTCLYISEPVSQASFKLRHILSSLL